jgi:uncharacterized protein YndB with AHSA1/START domain
MLGRLDRLDDRWQLHFTRTLAHDPHKVWTALTEPEHLDAWFPTSIQGARAAGAPLRFAFRHDEGPAFDGEMTIYDPPRLLEFRWGDETLRFELAPDGAGTVLTLLVGFDELGTAARDAAGWHVCLDALEHDLAGEDSPWTHRDRWDEVHPAYVERFGAEASTIGPP